MTALRARLIRLVRLTRAEYFADLIGAPPVCVALLLLSLQHFDWLWLPLFTAGAATWTFYEYAIHRWFLHRAWFFRDLHGLHHADQTDYIGTHPLVTVALYLMFWWCFGIASGAFVVGFSVGYVLYAFAHAMFHYAPIRSDSILFPLRVRHAIHHARHDVNYGVITSIWDRLFGTAA